ncbi:hypothetical protein PCASD_23394 [Puccinia coronata f. sp. avenae]|uniref:Uncharacterized protein n=1 Tax=Puccinia coronata f. sp. avenae TaxID=200324 RepID=A0A2N5SKC8_9BASI|nr:hypothetical protein PCASD_23394 [Puccinia coronata f. sp. avenae]
MELKNDYKKREIDEPAMMAHVFMAERFAGALPELWFLSKASPKSSNRPFLEAIAIGIYGGSQAQNKPGQIAADIV